MQRIIHCNGIYRTGDRCYSDIRYLTFIFHKERVGILDKPALELVGNNWKWEEYYKGQRRRSESEKASRTIYDKMNKKKTQGSCIKKKGRKTHVEARHRW